MFFGIFFAIFSTSGIWGNLFSYAIINESNHTRNASCGVYFSPSSKGESDESGNVSNLTVSRSILSSIDSFINFNYCSVIFYVDYFVEWVSFQ